MISLPTWNKRSPESDSEKAVHTVPGIRIFGKFGGKAVSMFFRSIYILRFLLIVAFLQALTGFMPVNGQKVALVLSGGGSKGLAHIGVIRALEEHHIPIDYIAGTSIGAIIGSLYAIGYSPDEIETLVLSDDFQRWATGTMEDKYVYFFRKEDPNASWVSLDFNFKKKLTSQLPSNVISPYIMDYAMLELFSSAARSSRYSFDSLMVPFRCVVADVDSSEAVVLRDGDLNSAVRGSMTLPFVFKPIRINGKLVFDGGMYNNFPVDVAHNEFHPDVIIGSRVAERYCNPDPNDFVEQLQTMLMARQSDSIPYTNSVLIVPNLPKASLLNFGRVIEFEDSGYVATNRRISEIRMLIHDSVKPENLTMKRVAFRQKMVPVFIDSIVITGLNRSQSEYIIKELKRGRKYITLSQLKQEYFKVLNEGQIRNIYPVARVNAKTGNYILYLDILKADNFNIEFGGNMSMGSNSLGFLELQYKYLWKTAFRFMANGYFGRFYNSVKGAARVDFNSQRPVFLELSYTYNNFDYFNSSTYFFDDKTPSYILQREGFADLIAGIPVTNKGKLTLAANSGNLRYFYYQTNTFSRSDTADQTRFDFIAPRMCFELNNLNRKQYASAGARFGMMLSYIAGVEKTMPGSTSANRDTTTHARNWFNFKIIWDNYFQTIGPLKLGIYLEGNFSNHPLFSNYTSSQLYMPAFQPLPEMQARYFPSYRAATFGALGLKGVFRIYKKVELRLEGYLFQPYKEVILDQETQQPAYGPAFSSRSVLGTAMLVYNTFLGPLSLGVNYYDKQADAVTFNLNFGYILFNRKALP